ncbi:MAG TPA: hypothetical protein VLM75_05505 [Spirochaetota bacterium]|nr:hypothetical protein [Spirochaetota bacterium]
MESWSNKVFINGRIIDVEKSIAEFAQNFKAPVKGLFCGERAFSP